MRDGHTGRALRRTRPIAALAAALVVGTSACGGDDQSDELIGVQWRWSGLREGPDETGLRPITDSGRYLLTLHEDGAFDAKADCNRVRGTYTHSGSELTLEPGRTTKAACGAESLSKTYIGLLARVADYDVYQEASLALGLEKDGGHMYFFESSP